MPCLQIRSTFAWKMISPISSNNFFSVISHFIFDIDNLAHQQMLFGSFYRGFSTATWLVILDLFFMPLETCRFLPFFFFLQLAHAEQFFAIFKLITNDFVWLLKELVWNNVSLAFCSTRFKSYCFFDEFIIVSLHASTRRWLFSRLRFCFVWFTIIVKLCWGYLWLLQVKTKLIWSESQKAHGGNAKLSFILPVWDFYCLH